MRNFLSIIALIVFQIGFSQIKFEKMPNEANEIHFTYKLSSKIFIDESGVYADSLFFRKNFRRITSSRIVNPRENFLNTKVEWNAFRKADKQKLLSILYHLNESYTGIHFIEQSKTVIWAERNDKEIEVIFKKYFDKDYALFKYKIELDYSKKIKHVLYPDAYYQFGFGEIQKEINWTSKTQGLYTEEVKKNTYLNTVSVDEDLSKYITMGYIFKNNDFGVSKIESFESLLELIEVKYK